MGLVVSVFDGINARPRQPAMQLRLVSERVTARELIERRVRQEVSEQNLKPQEYFRTLIRPTNAEETLNGYRLRSPRPIDVELQVARGFDAFAANGFFLLVDDRQLVDLDEAVTLTSTSVVTFLKLVQLVGG
jgi:hypothetical protein